ncbi:MAG: glycosyltransferase family 39 protein [Chloroflexi bacterium]|nr:glycosyltransferase family 39 protein [Chloroflexota bacterium]
MAALAVSATTARPSPPPRAFVSRFVAFARAHPDLILMIVLLVVAAVVRAAFVVRAPLFIRRDSIAYFQVGYEFAHGLGFDLPLRRTPLYPLFIAGVVALFGEDLRGLALAQHLLGLATVAATYWLGRAMFGRTAGAVAGLLVAVSAPLLILEHYILAEPLFIPLLSIGLGAIVAALRYERGWLFLVGGIVLALAALSRPIGQALLPIVPLALLVEYRGRLRAWLHPTALVLAGFAIILAPWVVRTSFVTGKVDGAGALGQTLIGRIIRHDEGFTLPDPDSPAPSGDARNPEIRKLILTQMARDARPSAINHRIRTTFDLTETEADRALRNVALEIFRDQPGRYVEGTLAKFRRLLVGEEERLRTHWSTRKDGELREDWLGEASIAHLYSPPSQVQELEYSKADAVTGIFQPYAWRYALVPLVFVGLGWGLVRGPRGATLLLLLAVVALVFPSAALVGYVPRYRYPVDPLLAILAAGGLVALTSLAHEAFRRGRLRPGGGTKGA